MTVLAARSSAEAHLYMELHACDCGEVEFTPTGTTVVPGDDQTSITYAGTCPRCGSARTFTFQMPAQEPFPDPDEPAFSTSGCSSLVDAGQWLWLADLVPAGLRGEPAELTGQERRQAQFDLRTAAAAVTEALRFVPSGAAAVPADALFTDQGRQVYARDPARLRRQRLLAARQALLDLAARYAPTTP